MAKQVPTRKTTFLKPKSAMRGLFFDQMKVSERRTEPKI